MKKWTALLLTLVLLFSLSVPALAFDKAVLSNQSLSVDGKLIDCEKYNIDGNNYFKLRDLAAILNGTGSQFDVGYDTEKRLISITTNHAYTDPQPSDLVPGEDQSATTVSSSQSIMINGALRDDLTAYNIGGYNFFQLRELGAALGFYVDYDIPTRTMLVTSRDTSEKTTEQIYASCMPAVFYIEVYSEDGYAIASGSGFFIDANGTAVTNHHVIYGASSAKVTLSDSRGSSLETLDVLGVYDWSEEEDWAVLKVDVTGNSWLRIGGSDTVVGGATVYALGSPLGLSASISDGMISNPARVVDGQTYIQTSAPISHGSSGGALVNKYGEVIGITAAGFDEGQNLNLAVPIDRITNAAHGALTPISETYAMPSGIVYPAQRYVTLQPGESIEDVIYTEKYNTNEMLTVQYEIEDESLVSCSWDGWGAGDTEVTLHLNAGETCGSTTVWIYLLTQDSEELLDYDYIYVTVAAGELELSKNNIEMDLNSYDMVWLTAHRYTSGKYSVHLYNDYKDILTAQWGGDWTATEDGGHKIPLYLAATGTGYAELRLEMFDVNTQEVLTTAYIYVDIVGGSLRFSDDYLEMYVGETRYISVEGEPAIEGTEVYLTADEYPSDVINWTRGRLEGNPAQLSVTALSAGWDCIEVTLWDADGNYLNSQLIDVYVSAGRIGTDADELELRKGETQTVTFKATVFDGRDVTIVPYLYNDNVSIELGEWDRVTGYFDLSVTGLKYGSIYIHLSMIDTATEEAIAEGGIYASVIGGTLDIGETEYMLAPGESKTITITGTPFDPSEKVYLAADEYGSVTLDWPRGKMSSNPAQFTVTGLAEGYDIIFITLYNEAGETLAEKTLYFYVSADGKGADE